MGVYHCFTSYRSNDPETQRRMDLAQLSWRNQPWIEVPIKDQDFPRLWKERGRALPYVKDMIDICGNACRSVDDIIVMSNADIIVRSDCCLQLAAYMQQCQACYSFRRDFGRLDQIPPDSDFSKGNDYVGSDLYCFRKSWWLTYKSKMPDMILGLEAWDSCLRTLIETTNPGRHVSIKNIICHERHGGDNHWESEKNRYSMEGQHYCLNLAIKFLRDYGKNPEQFGIPSWYMKEKGL